MKSNWKYGLLLLGGVATAAISAIFDDMRSEEIAEMAADRAVRKLEAKEKTPEPVHKNRAQRRAEMKKRGH